MGAAEAIRDSIARVVTARTRAIEELDSGWTTDEERSAIWRLSNFKPINDWIAEGEAKVKSGRVDQDWLNVYFARERLYLNWIADALATPGAAKTANFEATALGVSKDIRKIANFGAKSIDKGLSAIDKSAGALEKTAGHLPWIIGGAVILYALFIVPKKRRD